MDFLYFSVNKNFILSLGEKKKMLRRQPFFSTKRNQLFVASSVVNMTILSTPQTTIPNRAFGDFGGAGPNIGAGSFGSQQSMNKTNKYINTQTTAAPIRTACGRTFDPMTFQELLQTVTDQSWATAIQRQMMTTDREYVRMLTKEGGGAMAIDDLVLKGLGGSDEEAMANLKKLLESDYKASLSVCALQDAYTVLREKRDMNKTKEAAAGQGGAGAGAGGDAASLRAPFGGASGTGGN